MDPRQLPLDQPLAESTVPRAERGQLKDTLVLLFTLGDPGATAGVRWLAVAGLAYLFLPLDLIPDQIPLLGQLDDLFIVPAILSHAAGMLPESVYRRGQARSAPVARALPWIGVAIVALSFVTGMLLAAAAWAGLRWLLAQAGLPL